MAQTDKVVVRDLFKVFGDEPEKAMALFHKGRNKEEIFESTGQTMGVVGANFEVREGEIFVVMGLSGSGKSTLVRLLNRLIEPTAGQILIDGVDIAAMSDDELLKLRRKQISMVFQSFALMPHLTVEQNAAFGLELAGVPVEERLPRAREALDQVGLTAWCESYPEELSGGMQQRVGLARALANDPSVMLMDEAFSALDPLIRSEMQDELLRLQDENQRTVIFISHDLDEAMRIGDRIAIMEGGRVVQVGAPDEILKNPANDYIRAFFRGVNVETVLTAGDIARKQQVTLIDRESMGVKTAITRMGKYDRQFAYVVDKKQGLHGIVSVDSLANEERKEQPKLSNAFIASVDPIKHDTVLSEIIGTIAESPCGVPVINDKGTYMGVISKATLLETLDRETGETANG